MGTQESADTFNAVEPSQPHVEDAEWVVAKCLLSANDRTSALLEQLLLDAYADGDSDTGYEVEHIDRALDELERAKEELELARANAAEQRGR